jgi:hypothetical protein
MSQDSPPRSWLRKGAYPTDVPPGIRGLRSKTGIFGLVLVLVPGMFLVTVAVQTLTGVSHQRISGLNMGRGIGACGLFIFYGYMFLKTAVTGEDYKGQRDKVARHEAQLLRDQQRREGRKTKQHPPA